MKTVFQRTCNRDRYPEEKASSNDEENPKEQIVIGWSYFADVFCGEVIQNEEYQGDNEYPSSHSHRRTNTCLKGLKGSKLNQVVSLDRVSLSNQHLAFLDTEVNRFH